jgi:hypothetical protein
MPVYLMRFSLTPETWSRLIQNPEDRRDTARAYVEEVGGALAKVETTVLMTVEETLEALAKSKGGRCRLSLIATAKRNAPLWAGQMI